MKEFVFIKKEDGNVTKDLIILSFSAIIILILCSSLMDKWQPKMLCLNPNFKFLKQLIPFTFASLVFILSQKIIFKKPILELFTSRKKFDWKRFFYASSIWGFILCSLFFIQYLANPTDFVFQFEASKFLTLLLISLVFVTLQTLFEELLFRSILLHTFGSIINRKLIICLFISLIFTSLHLANPEISILGPSILIYYFLTSMFLSLITIVDNGIELSFGFHAVNNLFGSLILTNNWQVFQTKALFIDISPAKISWDIWLILLFLYPLLIYLYFKITKTKFGSIFDNK
jgi:uncharacterized protein